MAAAVREGEALAGAEAVAEARRDLAVEEARARAIAAGVAHPAEAARPTATNIHRQYDVALCPDSVGECHLRAAAG